MSYPVKGNFKVSAGYGQRGSLWRDGHKGIDFVSDDKRIYAATDGRVRVIAYDGGGWGNYLSVGDKDGMRHLYCHLKSVSVKVGQDVKAGDVIGIMGSTGNSTGVHLHYQINYPDGTPRDPAPFLKNGGENMYKDDDKIAPWAKDAVYQAKEKGLLVGDTDGNFRPDAYLTRQEAAVMIMRLQNK